jgi:membrane protease YdiL (CAAX protease family)
MALYCKRPMTMNSDNYEAAETVPEKRVWGFWATAGFGALVLVVSVIIEALIAVVVIIVAVLPELDFTAGEQVFEDIFMLTEEAATSYLGLMTAVSVIIGSMLCTGLVLLIIRARGRAGITEYLGLRRIGIRAALIALGAIVVYLAITVTASILLDRPEEEITLELYQTSVWPVLLWIGVVVIGPAFEEVLFRGFLFSGFCQSKVGPIGAIVITSIVFAALHVQYDIYSMGQILVLGIVLGVVRLKTRSLWAPLLMHAANNMVAMIVVALTASGVID